MTKISYAALAAMFHYAAFDPRPTPEAKSANEAIVASALEAGSLIGIEVTVPRLAALCAVNIDGQHSGQETGVSAAKLAANLDMAEMPCEGDTLATVRADLDSIAAMAILVLRANGLLPLANLVEAIDVADTFSHGAWQPRPLPTPDQPILGDADLAAAAAAAMDFKVPLLQRVAWLAEWLHTGAEPAAYRARVNEEAAAVVAALEAGFIQIEDHWLWQPGGGHLKVAVVHSSHRAATTLGYCLAPVVVAVNDSFSFQGSPAHRKVTICQYTPGLVNLGAVTEALNKQEPGWGGSRTIIGSPQGVHTDAPISLLLELIQLWSI